MNIRPLNPGRVPADTTHGARPDRARDAGAEPGVPADAGARPAAAPGTDQVQISNASRALQPLGPARETNAALPAGRMREVLDRIATGFYDRAEVQDRMVQALARDLEAPTRS